MCVLNSLEVSRSFNFKQISAAVTSDTRRFVPYVEEQCSLISFSLLNLFCCLLLFFIALFMPTKNKTGAEFARCERRYVYVIPVDLVSSFFSNLLGETVVNGTADTGGYF